MDRLPELQQLYLIIKELGNSNALKIADSIINNIPECASIKCGVLSDHTLHTLNRGIVRRDKNKWYALQGFDRPTMKLVDGDW